MNLSERYKEKLTDKFDSLDVKLDGVLLHLEVTNYCNHKCVFCPNSTNHRAKMSMDYGFAERVIKECAGFLGKDRRICFHMNGEPLIYERLSDLIRLAKECNYDYIYLTSNGSLGTEERLQSILDAGLDSIKFSINAGTPETYQKIHGSNDYDKAIASLKYCYKYKQTQNPDLKVYVSCIGIKENYNELVQLQNTVQEFCDEIVFYHVDDFAGQMPQNHDLFCDLTSLPVKSFTLTRNVPCPLLWNSISITCEGYLTLCCADAEQWMILEDLKGKSVKDVWLGEKMMKVREKHLRGEISDMPCNFCINHAECSTRTLDPTLFSFCISNKMKKN